MDTNTVMGLAMGSAPGNDMLMPPCLIATTDKFKWRKRVMLWVTTVKRFAKGGDKRAKGILSTLGLTLYNALGHVFASQVEQSVEAQIRAVPRDWCRAVKSAVGDQVVFTTKRIQTPIGRVWVLVGAARAKPTTKRGG